jgi:hypothetical protein
MLKIELHNHGTDGVRCLVSLPVPKSRSRNSCDINSWALARAIAPLPPLPAPRATAAEGSAVPANVIGRT